MTLARDLKDSSGVLLYRAGTRLTTDAIHQLRSMGVSSLAIENGCGELCELAPAQEERINRLFRKREHSGPQQDLYEAVCAYRSLQDGPQC